MFPIQISLESLHGLYSPTPCYRIYTTLPGRMSSISPTQRPLSPACTRTHVGFGAGGLRTEISKIVSQDATYRSQHSTHCLLSPCSSKIKSFGKRYTFISSPPSPPGCQRPGFHRTVRPRPISCMPSTALKNIFRPLERRSCQF